VKCDIAPSRFEPDLEGDAALRRDALNLLGALSAGCAPLAFFDPRHRGVLDRLKFGNEGSRQRGRARLPSMSDEYFDACCREIARALAPGGYLMRWTDVFGLCEGHHLRVSKIVKPVDLNRLESLRIGMASGRAGAAIICLSYRSPRSRRGRGGTMRSQADGLKKSIRPCIRTLTQSD
jgi:site-specific DNA-methyltransferase (adenine-specific)